MQTDQNAEPVYIATVTMQMIAVTVHFVAVGQFIGFYNIRLKDQLRPLYKDY